MMCLFVQGFWFDMMLLRDGKIGAGLIMAVFWVCLFVM
jgi:ATP-binding cassette subfamily B (MDR/TAP) protein 1